MTGLGRAFRAATASILWPIAASAAQQAATIVVDVRVVDTMSKPVGGSEVSAVRELRRVLASGTTDDAGRRRLVVPRGADADLQIVVRKIGYQRAERFVVASRDTLAIAIVLHESARELPAVTVTAEQDVRRRANHIEADEIAASERPILDGLDVLTKLRPDMIYSRIPGGADPCGLFYVWVNGKRIVFPPIDAALAARQSQLRHAARATPHIGPTGLATVPVSVQSVLSSIHPEHIAEINYADCNDFSVDATRARNAVFVTLKPGVGFEPGRGSYVVDTGSATDAAAPTAPIAAYRRRLVGVFDDSTGDPVADVTVIDVATGTRSVTTTTGTLSLWFLPEGVSTLRIEKAGYATQTLDVSISPRDTLPITLVLARAVSSRSSRPSPAASASPTAANRTSITRGDARICRRSSRSRGR